MKLIPASRAFATIRPEVASSVGPPNIMVPRQIGETFRPLRPSFLYCIFLALYKDGSQDSCLASSLRAKRSNPDVIKRGVWTTSSLALQDLEHTAGHGDTALVDRHFRIDEDEAPCRADHVRSRD